MIHFIKGMCFDEFHIIREIILGHGVVVFNKFVFVFFNVIHHVTSMWSVWWHGMILVVRGLNNTSEATLPILNTAPNTNTQPNTNIQTNTDFTWIALVDFLLPRWLRTTSIALIRTHSITSTNNSSNQIDKQSKFCGNWTNPLAKGKTKLIHFDLPSIYQGHSESHHLGNRDGIYSLLWGVTPGVTPD